MSKKKEDLNSHCGTGRLGRDPEVRYVGKKNTPVTDLSVAINVGWGDRGHSIWTRITVWGTAAEFLCQYARKGDLIGWTGATYDVEQFTKNDGAEVERHYFDLAHGGKVNILTPRSDDGGEREQPRQDTAEADDGQGSSFL